MSRIAIDRLDLTLEGMSEADAREVQRELPGAMQRSVQRALRGQHAMRLDRTEADLGLIALPGALPARAVADAIAARFADWLGTQAATPQQEL
ncbi:MAG: hypothetical protein IAE86_12520 [Burkholderiaceae bacterium]|nr:hypothetical protein [Burkholderiaceae bacterium]